MRKGEGEEGEGRGVGQTRQLTWFREAQDFRHISHEDPTLQLQFRVLVPDLGACGSSLVLFVFALGWCYFLTTQQDTFKEVNLVVPLLLRLSGDHSIDTVEEELSKVCDPVVLPVVDSHDEFIQSLVQKVPVDSLVRLLQNTLGSFDSGGQILFGFLVIALFEKVLENVSAKSKADLPRRKKMIDQSRSVLQYL